MKRLILCLLSTLALILTACSAATPTPDQPAAVSTEPASLSGDLTRVDQQGAVAVEITPLNLSDASDDLEFDVAMNTHSVDLSMDLSALATLTTDTGITVQATKWEAPGGGHHVSGKLIFPATQDGKSILEGVGTVTLTILNVDTASRIFEWQFK